MFEGLLQPTHVIVLLVIALLVLGPKRLPEVGKSIGQGLRGFKESLADDHDGRREEAATPTVAASSAADVREDAGPEHEERPGRPSA